MAKTIEAVMLTDTDECILWPHGMGDEGYGQIQSSLGHRAPHSLVCELRHGPKPDRGMFAAHECGVRACFNPRHLTWKTPLENQADRYKHGTNLRPEDVNTCKLSWPEVRVIRSLHSAGMGLAPLGKSFGVTPENISYIVRHRTWKHDPDLTQSA